MTDLEAALALAAAATDGPWFADGSEIYSEFQGGPWVGETCQADDPEKTAANAAFIAAARTLVPQMAEELRRTRAAVRLLNAENEECHRARAGEVR